MGLDHKYLQQLRKIIATITTQDNLLSAQSVSIFKLCLVIFSVHMSVLVFDGIMGRATTFAYKSQGWRWAGLVYLPLQSNGIMIFFFFFYNDLLDSHSMNLCQT